MMAREGDADGREPLLRDSSLKPRKVCNVDTESLTYNPPTSQLRLHDHKNWGGRRHLYGYTGRTAAARVSTIVCGVLIGVTAVAIQEGIEYAVHLRNGLLQHLVSDSMAKALLVWAALSAGLVGATGLLVQVCAPKAAGAGVTLVMAFLNGVDIRGLLSMPVFALKFVGLIASRVAGLAVGPEGPMVHLGACLATFVCSWEPWFLSRAEKSNAPGGKHEAATNGSTHTNGFASYTSLATEPADDDDDVIGRRAKQPPPLGVVMKNIDLREMVSAGAAAGIAAAFGAPIGGVLYSLEEAATHWDRKVGWRCFLCTTVASFTLAQLHPRGSSGMLSFKADSPYTNRQWLMQAPFIVLVSAAGGLLGAAFNVMRKKLWPIRASRKRTVLRLAEAAGVALASVLLTAAVSLTVGRCLPVPDSWEDHKGIQLTCRPGQYNDLATALLSSDVWVIRTLLNLGSETLPVRETCSLLAPCYFSWASLATLSATYLVLMALASSICVPGGLFMPSIMVGGSFGALFGFALMQILPYSWDIQPGVYALLCATAVLGGVFRSTFSLVVIVVEGTKGIDFLFGIIMAILISNLVASRVLPDGVYESELERDGTIYYLRPEPPNALRSKTAADIMATPVVGVEALVPVTGVRRLLAATSHNGFPVFSNAEPRDPATGMGRLDGFILRSQLEVLLSNEAFCTVTGQYVSAPPNRIYYEARLHHEMRAMQQTVVGKTELQPLRPGLPASRVASGSQHDDDWTPPASRLAHRQGSLGSTAEQPGYKAAWEGLLPPGIADPAGWTPPPPAGEAGGTGAAGSSNHNHHHHHNNNSSNNQASLGGRTAAAEAADHVLTLEAAAAAAGLLASPRQRLDALGPAAAEEPAAVGAGLYLNLAPFMDRAPLTARKDMLGTEVHHMFLAMSLRHLCVVDSRNCVCGIITRKDLDHAAGEGWWRLNKIAPKPDHSEGLRRNQSWLALSLAAPRRLLSSIQQALSPITSPLASRRGTPRGTPKARTPRDTPSGTPKAGTTPRSSGSSEDLEAAVGARGGSGSGSGKHGGDSSLHRSSGSPFWQSPAAWAEQLAAEAAAEAVAESGVTGPLVAAAEVVVVPADGSAPIAASSGMLPFAGSQARQQYGQGAAAASSTAGGLSGEGSSSAAQAAAGGLPSATSASSEAPLQGRPPLRRISPKPRHPLLSSFPPSSSAEGAAEGPVPPLGGPTPFLLSSIEEDREQGGDLRASGELPRWARAVSKKSSRALEAFGSIAFAGEEEEEEESGEEGRLGWQS